MEPASNSTNPLPRLIVDLSTHYPDYQPPREPLHFPLPVPDSVRTKNETEQRSVLAYLEQLDAGQRQAYHIAFDHLGSSFHILRSNGYLEWKKNQK